MPRDILQNSLETMSAMVNAAGTKVQIELLGSLKENMEILLSAEEDSDIEDFTEILQQVITILEDPEFDLEFIRNEIRAIKLSLSEMTNKMLRASVNKTKQILEENKVEKEVEETKPKPTRVIGETESRCYVVEEEVEETKTKPEDEEVVEEKVAEDKTANKENKNKEEEKEMAKTVEELKEKLRKAKEAAAKCDSSTLAKVGKVGLGLAIVAGAAYGGYYYANNYSGRNTTIIINGGDED